MQETYETTHKETLVAEMKEKEIPRSKQLVFKNQRMKELFNDLPLPEQEKYKTAAKEAPKPNPKSREVDVTPQGRVT